MREAAGRRTARVLLHDVGLMMQVPGALALPALVVAVLAREWFLVPGFLAVVVLGGGGGWLLRRVKVGEAEKNGDEGRSSRLSRAVVALAWLVAALLAALPFYAAALVGAALTPGTLTPLSPTPLSPTTAAFGDFANAFFEAMSGITVTGLTMARDSSDLPRTLQWWRSSLQWLGGIGLVFLALPLANSGEDPFAEHSGELGTELNTDLLGEQGARAAPLVWGIYVSYTALAVLGFWGAGMPLWEALNHGMTGISTGGFAVTGESFRAYGAPVKLVGVVVILLGTVSFSVHFALVFGRRWRLLYKNIQMVALWCFLAAGFLVLLLVNWREEGSWLWIDSLFLWVSALGTCGFYTVDLPSWSPAALFLLVLGMFIGGASGSTTGGVKLGRAALLFKSVLWRMQGLVTEDEPSYHFGGDLEKTEVYRRAHHAGVILTLFLTALFVGTLALLLLEGHRFTPLQLLFEAASALGNTGLSMGVADPDLSTPAKLVLAALMWVGRLEVLAVLLLIAGLLGGARNVGRATGGGAAGEEGDDEMKK